ncbi:hypothetical protein [Wenjunlia tyrosinilytica]|jgi:hypothetical protein|uniref:Uncharacterized protein n=1 Tax=Wenjunlia tyrosinilytica TaxID=1544741 RepID=A0A918DZS8_9ACTN|nr:hypothetical protein [Wenjunlia tyrosinilytica]GGO94935.1 hypothetical protein GCM10012280_50990 [Wenjunlia tyrosinilytica]
MDRYELHNALRAAGVGAGRYEIEGLSSGPHPVDHYFLAERPDGWVVGVHERGRREVIKRFPTEDGACRYLYTALTDEGPPPTPLTPEETEELIRNSDAIQRQAREQVNRALKAKRERNPGTEP